MKPFILIDPRLNLRLSFDMFGSKNLYDYVICYITFYFFFTILHVAGLGGGLFFRELNGEILRYLI